MLTPEQVVVLLGIKKKINDDKIRYRAIGSAAFDTTDREFMFKLIEDFKVENCALLSESATMKDDIDFLVKRGNPCNICMKKNNDGTPCAEVVECQSHRYRLFDRRQK